MKARTSFLKRCLAFALALVLLASSANMGIVTRANAAKPDSTTAGKLVAKNYDLTEAERNLLNSGLLAEETYTYDVPEDTDDLVSVDTDNNKITAKSPTLSWKPTAARIVVGEETKETVELTNGVGTYTYGENAFAVQVDYVLGIEVPKANQETLLNTAAWLKNGTANLANAYKADTNLGTVVLAMDTLVDLANGITMSFGAGSITAQFGADAAAAVKALNAEVNANSGQLDLQVKNAAYNAGASKTQYLLENGAAYKATLVDTYNALNAIKNDPLSNNVLLDDYLKGSDSASHTKWMAFKSILNNLVATLEPAVKGDWTAAEKGTALVSESVDYAKLDTLVAALGEMTPVSSFKNLLTAAEATVAQNMSMFNVTVKVVLKTVEDKADSNVLVETGAESKVLTLAEGAPKAEVEAAAAPTIESALNTWGIDVEKFDVKYEGLSDTLTENITYTITYSPKTYPITYKYVDVNAPTSVPYGYQMTLPKHSDATKAYDYTVNGEKKAQGDVVVIVGDTTIDRASGKSYAGADLYSVVADNYGDALTKDILKSGALKDNVFFSYRKPDPTDAGSLLTLKDGTLTAAAYDAAYAGLSWAPYTYGENGTENTFSGNTAPWTGKQVKVLYKLTLDNFGQEKAQEVLKLATTLKAEAEEQKGAMDSLAGMEDTLAQLDKTKLGALNGVIDVTDFTEGDGTETDAENLAIRAELKAIVSNIIANNLDSNNYLKIYNIVRTYKTDGMSYYYKNYDAIKTEVNSLSGYLSNLMDKEEALRIMCTAAGYGEYADKIADVETKLNDYNARLSAPNAAIDVNSSSLGKLVTALTVPGDTKCEAGGAPYILSEAITAQDESSVMVQIIIETPNGNGTVTTDSMDRGAEFTQDMLNDLKAKADAKVAELLGENIKYYTKSTSGDDLTALAGTPLDANANAYYTYAEKQYTVKIEGEADQTVKISDLEIDLPKHPNNGWVYKYTIDGVEGITASTYAFTKNQIDSLFTGGTYTITRVAINEGEEKLEGAFTDWLIKDQNGNITGLEAKVDGNKDGVLGFVNTIVNSGYSYIGLNGEPLLYMNDEDTLEIKLQTLINALMKDNEFGSDTLISLGKNGKGEFVHASMQLGKSATDIQFEDLDFVLYLNSVPEKMVTVSKAMETINTYMSFKSNNGVMDVNINLPEKVYEVYLAAMLATGNVTKDNMDAINSEIAFQFLWDYVELIMATEANTTTYTNTLAKLGKEHDLTGYEKYYQLAKKALTNDGVVVNPETDGEFDMSVTANGQKAIDGLINMIGIDVSQYATYMGMIYEYKGEGAPVFAAARANLVNSKKDFEAALIDLNASGVTNKFDFTENLPARVNEIADKAAVILLDTVDGDLTFKGTTILDLNGQTVNGNIVSNGTLLIVDSALDTVNGGKVTGSVSGNVQIIAGSYGADVSGYLKDGYKQVNGAVQNTLYTIESDDAGNVCFVLNPDVMSEDFPNAKALAVDIAADLVLNYYTAAALTAENNGLYNVNIDDLIGLISSSNKVDDLIVKVLGSVNAPGMSNFANIIIEDLLSFGDLADALVGGTEIASYTMGTAPWAVTVEHKTEEDYITFGIGSALNQKTRAAGKTFNVSLKFNKQVSEDNTVVKLLRELEKVAVASAMVNLEQPTYDGAKNAFSITGSGEAEATLTLNKNSNYATILAVILANGDAAQKDNLVAAVNADDMDALKDAIDKTSVAELFTALKVLNRNDKFANVAANVGVTVDVADAAELESLYHLFLCAGGKALEELEITGMNSKFGALDQDDDGIYEFTADATRKPNASARGYSVYAEGSAKVSLTVNLFGEEDCLLGDVNHDNEITTRDAAMILRHCVGETPSSFCFYGADVNGDGEITTRDASIILKYCVEDNFVFPAARN